MRRKFFTLFCNYFVKTGQKSSHHSSTSCNVFSKCEILNAINLPKKSCTFNQNFRLVSTTVKGSEKLLEDNEKNNSDNGVIYYGTLTGQIKGVKVFTCVSSLGGIVLQPLVVQNILSGDNLPLGLAICTCVGFFTFVTPLLIHLFTKKYVTEIRYAEETDTYTATTLSFFLQKINIKFKVEDVAVPSMLPFFTTMSIKGRPVFIVSDCFLAVEHYIRMMGYDKPIDLKLNTKVDDLVESKEKFDSK